MLMGEVFKFFMSWLNIINIYDGEGKVSGMSLSRLCLILLIEVLVEALKS